MRNYDDFDEYEDCYEEDETQSITKILYIIKLWFSLGCVLLSVAWELFWLLVLLYITIWVGANAGILVAGFGMFWFTLLMMSKLF